MSVLTRWQARLYVRARLLTAARRQHKLHPTVKTLTKVKLRKAQVEFAQRVIARYQPKLNETVTFDGTPVFRGLALMLNDARLHGWRGGLNSADRRKGVAERYGKRSQAALYAGWIAHLAGFFPANPPGRSTHELRSDGVPYRGPVGRPLSWWQLGLDTTYAPELRRILVTRGFQAFQPYSAGSEIHHTNLRESPARNLRRLGLA